MLSVITPSRGRHDLLMEKARSLARQTLPPGRFEWLVWLNEDETELEHLRRSLAHLELPFRWSVEGGSAREVGEARNLAADLAHGRVLLFSDDDCLPAPAALAEHLRLHQRHSRSVGIGSLRLPESLREGGRREPFERTARLGRLAFWFNMTGANSSIRRELFREVGGYDPSWRGYGGEDMDLALRLKRAGARFVALPEAIAEHVGRVLDDTDKAYSAGKAHWCLYRRYRTGGWALGVHPVQLALKGVILRGPLARLFDPAVLAYEQAYARGAEDARRTVGRMTGPGA